MKYNVVVAHSKEDNDFLWHVYENATRQIVGSFFFEEEAEEYADFYEHGGGFDGFTPVFMLRSVTYPVTNVNDEFTRIFD